MGDVCVRCMQRLDALTVCLAPGAGALQCCGRVLVCRWAVPEPLDWLSLLLLYPDCKALPRRGAMHYRSSHIAVGIVKTCKEYHRL